MKGLLAKSLLLICYCKEVVSHLHLANIYHVEEKIALVNSSIISICTKSWLLNFTAIKLLTDKEPKKWKGQSLFIDIYLIYRYDDIKGRPQKLDINTIDDIGANIFLINCSSFDQAESIMRNSHWNNLGNLLNVRFWDQSLNINEISFRYANFWIQVHNLSPDYWECSHSW